MMRVVEHRRDVTSLTYRGLWALGAVATLFSLVLACLMIVNNVRLKATDPVDSPALQRLLADLQANPQDEALREQIRELDHLARRAYFTSQHFNQMASLLLLGGVVVALAAFKTIGLYHRAIPFPDSHDPKDDLTANARFARQSVLGIGLVLVGLALSLALPWQSLLEQEPEAGPAATTTGGTAVSVAKQPDAAVKGGPGSGPGVASRGERKKHWPSFRGAAAGLSAAGELPIDWDAASGRGIAWKTPIPLPGFSSPIVWGDRIFVSGGSRDIREVYCIDAVGGELLWKRPVLNVPGSPAEPPRVTDDTGYAASTMTSDGVRVFAIFATGDLVALDFDGNTVWTRHLGVPENPYGHSSSLDVFEELLIVQFDRAKDGFVAGLDLRSGETRWKTDRQFGPSWSSPALIEKEGSVELVLAAAPVVVSYDPRSGSELWRVEWIRSAEVAPTPVFSNGLLFVAADHGALAAIDIGARKVKWENRDDIPGVATPIVVGDFLFGGLGEGGIVCWEASTGKTVWRHETDDIIFSSPILAGDRIYLPERSGRMHIFAASGEGYRPVGQPELGEEIVSTPAVHGRSLICRGINHLFRIGP